MKRSVLHAKRSRLSGFTLVELIVVIAIVGILAAILVPSMLGYVRSARYKSANANAKEVYTNLNAVLASCDPPEDYIMPSGTLIQCQSLQAQYDSMKALADMPTTPKEARSYLKSAMKTMAEDKDGYFGVVYGDSGYPLVVVWGKSNDAGCPIGRYPKSVYDDDGITWDNWYSEYEDIITP